MTDGRALGVNIDKFIKNLIKDAIKLRASDIHIEAFSDYSKIRLRVDGDLREYMRINLSQYEKLVSKIKLMAKMDISEKRRPQDANLRLKEFQGIDFRVSSLNTVNGEKIVLRILSIDEFKKTSRLLGFTEDSIGKIDQVLKKRSGMIIFTGPTGSGENSIIVIDTIIKLNQGLKASTKFLNKMILI